MLNQVQRSQHAMRTVARVDEMRAEKKTWAEVLLELNRTSWTTVRNVKWTRNNLYNYYTHNKRLIRKAARELTTVKPETLNTLHGFAPKRLLKVSLKDQIRSTCTEEHKTARVKICEIYELAGRL